MPGAPNRPPEPGAPPAPPPPVAEPPERKARRRLVPSHVALLLDLWKGGPPPEVLAPFDKADAAFRAGDFAGALTALDQLSIRFAEPRWPSLPEPFRRLRVPIPAPTPPHWDPDHGVAAEEKEARKARRLAEDQVALAEGTLAWATGHGVASDGLGERLTEARNALAASGDVAAVLPALDGFWTTLGSRLPPPKRAVARPPTAAAEGT